MRRLFGSAGNLLATLIDGLHTRLELLTVELQLEVRRILERLVLAIVVVFAAVFALVFAGFSIILAFWDTHRLLAAILVAVAFAGIALVAALVSANHARTRPRLLQGTLAELAADRERLRSRR